MNFLKEKKILMLWAFLPLVFTLDLCYDPTGNECAGIPFKTDFAVNNSDDLSYWLLFIYDNTAPNFVYIMNTDENNEVDIWLSDYGIHDLEVIFYGYTQSFDINQVRMNYMTIHVDNNFTFVSMLTFIELDIRFDININQGKARNTGKIDDINEFNSSRKYSRERLEFLDEDMNHDFDKDKTLISWSGYYLEIEYCFLKRNNFSSFSIILQFEKLKIPETFFGLIENISGNSISVIQLYIEDTPLKNITIELIASWNRIPTLSIEWGYTNAIIHHTISQTGNVVILLSNISITVTSGVQNATVNYKIYNDVSLIIHESIFPDCIVPNTVFLFNFAGIFNGSIVIPEECSSFVL
ncbi:hypothetical protein TRFO_27732 [Tritrichomonas foetus]|uniref:Uncharacterized protein n=1 Tax=Tritrichomonas foetus TaxID=1144522 RepID=A0A1J4JZS8_9EUKA|nr:hypothetical protein TRFO_27732 [Tritrichomonas foetus]|eukprot:OHT04665.1 hypothetical protein TRFO_27732 [Tritrichomonas foetus]